MFLYVSDLLVGIPKFLALLQEFGRISDYGVALWGSGLVPLTSVEGWTLDIVPFETSFRRFKHLGIWVTHDHGNLYRTDCLPLIVNLEHGIVGCWSLPHTLGGRMHSVEVDILPGFLCLFWNLPVFLTESFFTGLSS